MTLRLLDVGINKYKTPGVTPLQGCVNDVGNFGAILKDAFQYKPVNGQVLLNYNAKQDAIKASLRSMISQCQPGDHFIFHLSSHGSQIPDDNGDESDGMDEILCPTDLDWNRPFRDDGLAEIIKSIPHDVSFAMIADCCHSGSISRSSLWNPFQKLFKKMPQPRFTPCPANIILAKRVKNPFKKRRLGHESINPEMNHILLSGCADDETSADAYINGQYQGALTWALVESLREQPDITWVALHKKITALLDTAGFDQHPQLSGNDALINSKVFGRRS